MTEFDQPAAGRGLLGCLAFSLSAALFVSSCSDAVYELRAPLALANTGVSVPSDARKIRLGGSLYRRLSGSELRDAIVGKSMFHDPADGIVMQPYGRFFHPDGHRYWEPSDRVPNRSGSYSVMDKEVCVDTDGSPWCFSLFRSEEGAFLMHSVHRSGLPETVLFHTGTPYNSM